MKKIKITTLALSIMIAPMTWVASDAMATHPGHHNQMASTHQESCGCQHMKDMMKAFDLDKSQQAKIKTIKEDLSQSQQANREQMRSIRTQIHEFITSGSTDEAKLNGLIDQKKELLGQMIKARIMAKQQMYNVLTDKQKTQFKEKLQQWEQEHKAKHC